MIFSILVYIYIGYLTIAFGYLFYRSLSATKLILNPFPKLRLDIILITGLIFLSIICSILHFFLPISLFVTILFNVISIAYIYFDRVFIYGDFTNRISKFKKEKKINNIGILFFVIFLVILLSAQSYPYNYDTHLYHSQSIRWIECFSIIPGLGNLHGRLAFNSHYFLLCTLFNFSYLGLGDFNLLTSFLLLIFCSSCIYNIYSNECTESKIINYILLFFVFFFYYKWISSPTPDVIVTLIIWYIFIIFYQYNATQAYFNIKKWQFIFLTLCSFFVIVLKISAIAIILLPLILFFKSNNHLGKSKKTAFLYIFLIGLVTLTP